MRVVDIAAAALGCAALFVVGCEKPPEIIRVDPPDPSKLATRPARIEAGDGAAKRIQAALINAKPGEVVELGEGRFDCRATLSLDVSGVTVRGQGPDRTILAFKEQGAGTGGEGLLITSKENVVVEGLAVEDAKGDAIKAHGHEADRLPKPAHPSGPAGRRRPTAAMGSTRCNAPSW